jgi:hypothetical protein
LKTRRLLRDIDVDCRAGKNGGGDKRELLTDEERRWHVGRLNLPNFNLISYCLHNGLNGILGR